VQSTLNLQHATCGMKAAACNVQHLMCNLHRALYNTHYPILASRHRELRALARALAWHAAAHQRTAGMHTVCHRTAAAPPVEPH
jgi:hypothetical protein